MIETAAQPARRVRRNGGWANCMLRWLRTHFAVRRTERSTVSAGSFFGSSFLDSSCSPKQDEKTYLAAYKSHGMQPPLRARNMFLMQWPVSAAIRASKKMARRISRNASCSPSNVAWQIRDPSPNFVFSHTLLLITHKFWSTERGAQLALKILRVCVSGASKDTN